MDELHMRDTDKQITSFDEDLKQIETAFFNDECLDNRYKDKLEHLFHEPKEHMDVSSYLRLMYMKGRIYEQSNNKNAARYCALRMRWAKEGITHIKQRSRYLDYQEYSFSELEKQFMQTYTGYLHDIFNEMKRKLLVLSAILTIILFLVLTFLLKLNIVLAILEAFALGALNHVIQKKRLPDLYLKKQLEASSAYVEAYVLSFDKTYRIL